jgi:hypothetical protein
MQKSKLFMLFLLSVTFWGYKGNVAVAIADDDTFVKIQEMVNDLGGPAKQKANNGKRLACVNSGTKQITINSSSDGTSYKGIYKNCHEYGRTRDGNVEITTGGGGESARPAKLIDKAFDEMLDGDIAGLAITINKNKKLLTTSIVVEKSDGGTTKGWTLLMAAAQNNLLDAVKLLVKSGANVNELNSGHTNALWLAANKGNSEIVEFLISKGSKVNVQDDLGTSTLATAAARGYDKVVLSLIKAKADLNLRHKDGDTALFFAIGDKHTDIAIALIEAGANTNLTNKFDTSPLDLAVDRDDAIVVQKLLDAGAREGLDRAWKVAQNVGNQNVIAMLARYRSNDK